MLYYLGQQVHDEDENKAESEESPGITFGGSSGGGIRLPSISFGNGGLTIGGGGGSGSDDNEHSEGEGKQTAESSYSNSNYGGKSYTQKPYYYSPPRPRLKLKLPHFPKTYIESNLKLPPIKLKLHAAPRVKITTGTKDPLEKKPNDDHYEEDIFAPPEPFPKKGKLHI